MTSHRNKSYILAFNASPWGGMHLLAQTQSINSFSRHGISLCWQIMNGAIWKLSSLELEDAYFIKIKDNIFSYYDQLTH